MWVKICANTNAEDALAAVEFGADAVGFVFAASSRQVTAAQVKAITPLLPVGVERVGVFYGGDADEIGAAATEAGLTAVQLHGGLDRELARQLRDKFSIIQTLHWTLGEDEESAARLGDQLRQIAAEETDARILIDTKAGDASGGTGRSFDWAKAREVLASEPALRIIVAGGLKPENIAEAIRQLKPWGVDVASGVESEPGKKDRLKLKAFIENARGA